MKGKDIAGKVFSRLTAIKRDSVTPHGQSMWECICECGSTVIVRINSLTGGSTKSCGCLNKEIVSKSPWKIKHSQAIGGGCTRIYISWYEMVKRCTNPRVKSYPRYGGRGIKVCDRWNPNKNKSAFLNFASDMGSMPENMSLDRINNNGNYEPGNCRWATHKEQSINRRTTIWVLLDGIKMSRRDASKRIAEKLGCKYLQVEYRLKKGEPVEQIMGEYEKN